MAGIDNLVDFNGISARQEGLSYVKGATEDFESLRNSLLNRRKYERLACRPFNGLFLPEKHL